MTGANLDTAGTPRVNKRLRWHAKGESNKFVYDTRGTACPSPPISGTTHQHPWKFKRVWHLEPSPTDLTCLCGVEDAGLFARLTAEELERVFRTARPRHRPRWQPAPAECAFNTVILDPANPTDLHCISAQGAFRTDDAARPGSQSTEVCIHNTFRAHGRMSHCVHHVAMHPSRPNVLFMQNTGM